MKRPTPTMLKKIILTPFFLGTLWLAVSPAARLTAQEDSATEQNAEVQTSDTPVGGNAPGTIIIRAGGEPPEPPVFFSADARATVRVGRKGIEQTIEVSIKVVQGNARSVSLGVNGPGEITMAQGEGLASWAVRQVGSERFLDLHLDDDVSELTATVLVDADYPATDLPVQTELAHLSPGDSVGFNSLIDIQYHAEVDGGVIEADGFSPLESDDSVNRLQSAKGGKIALDIHRAGSLPSSVELVDTSLDGELHPNGKSILFRLRGTAEVTEGGSEITILKGQAAVSNAPTSTDYRLRLASEGDQPVYRLRFPDAGIFPLELDFVATLTTPEADAHAIDFTVAAGAVVPVTLRGLDTVLRFRRDQQSIVPSLKNGDWVGFLPATGHAKLQWKTARKTGEGKLFFTTSGLVETQLGVGLLRQDHRIEYQVLQGELDSVSLVLHGPGEILDVRGNNIVAWKVVDQGENRQLDITLSQPLTGNVPITIRSQTPFGAFPVTVEGLRLQPVGAIRHSGFLRLSSLGSVRLEPTGLGGLSQLAPEQFPGDPSQARQVFVYRFPSADYQFGVSADRIQPEVSISELVLYQLTETDRVIMADVELDIREAPIREWDFRISADYSVVSVTGASVSDYIAATDVADGVRNLKVMFGQDVAGRQLVRLHLEKSEAAAAGDWTLPRIEYPDAKSVRGDIGVIGAPGYRIEVGATDLLVDKPLSYFPKPTPGLQQAFRIREPGWSATMTIQPLERSVQSDVFHLYSLSQETVYGSALINYFVTGAPVAEWRINVPAALGNVMVDGQDIRTWRREEDTLIVTLHQPVMGAYTLLVTFEEKADQDESRFRAGQVAPLDVQGERGYIQVVSPMQVELNTESISEDMLKLDPLELPAEFRLLSTAPPLGTWQYTERPIALDLTVNWFEPGTTVAQIVEFSEANSRVSKDGELVTDVLYYVKSRGRRSLRVRLPAAPVRLWEVTVNGQPVTARQTDEETLIPLPGETDPNNPVEVRLRLGKPAVSESRPKLALPIVFTPVLKTQWNVSGDEKHVLVPSGGTVSPTVPVLRPSGFEWVARRGLISLVVIALLTALGVWLCGRPTMMRIAGLISLLVAIGVCFATSEAALHQIGSPQPLRLSLPVLASGELAELHVQNTPLWQMDLSWTGMLVIAIGLAAILWSYPNRDRSGAIGARAGGALFISLGVLMQGGGAPWFYGLLGIAIVLLVFCRPAWQQARATFDWLRTLAKRLRSRTKNPEQSDPSGSGAVSATIVLFALLAASTAKPGRAAELPDGFFPFDSIQQQWTVSSDGDQLDASGSVKLTGKPGEQFVLLHAPAVLTGFDGPGLRLSKREWPAHGQAYVVTIPPAEDDSPSETRTEFAATFEYQLDAVQPTNGIAVLTGPAAIHQIDVEYDQPGWEVVSPNAVRVESIESKSATKANVLLGPAVASSPIAKILFQPETRDVTTESTKFFVEVSNLYLAGPGVVDGRHRLHFRTSQGQISELSVRVPRGLTASSVSGPVGSWQFDADSGTIRLQIEPAQSQPFDIMIETQRGLDSLPADIKLAPLMVDNASGQVGLVAVAFGADAQPEQLDSQTMSAVNLGDFDAGLIPNQQAVLHRVYRYGADGGELELRVAPVEPEVRLISQQVLSLGDERVVLGINFAVEISRTGLFQLSFPLPDGLEVESLSGAALHHWSELSENGQRRIILHLNGKTIGTQSFALTLAGAAPTEAGDWPIPRFELNEATRQSGELVVRPSTGIRLRTVSRQNVSETDPRAMGGKIQGSLAFRLLQRDWNLVLGIEKLDPWVTGQIVHEVMLREGQTRSAVFANFNVQNASIRTLPVRLPITNDDEIRTVRAVGDTVSDFVRSAEDSDVWEVRFKRRVVGRVQFRIEYERRGDRENESETLSPIGFPDARQLSYFFAVRAGGRLELETGTLSQGWQRADWNAVPQSLRELGNRSAPALVLRAVGPGEPMTVRAVRHSIADSLKLRVAEGTLTTVLSPTGDQLTAVDVTMEVIQRSSLSLGLPEGGELLNVFVNGESVHSIRLGEQSDVWQFYILPGIDDRTAKVRFVYSLTGRGLSKLTLESPHLNVPLENIRWDVIAPQGYELTDNDGNLELTGQTSQGNYDRDSYLSKMNVRRQAQAQNAAKLLEQANQFLQAGEQTKARWALNSVANQYALDAASNEDARVQLENLQTQQAIVGLNTRRQRLYLDNDLSGAAVTDNQQLREAAAVNPILQQDALSYRPQQLSELLRGNTSEDNAVLSRIAGRLVQHQRTTDPAPQAILISLPEEGAVYSFSRTVQVAENAPLELELEFDSLFGLRFWRSTLALLVLAAAAAVLARAASKTFRPESV